MKQKQYRKCVCTVVVLLLPLTLNHYNCMRSVSPHCWLISALWFWFFICEHRCYCPRTSSATHKQQRRDFKMSSGGWICFPFFRAVLVGTVLLWHSWPSLVLRIWDEKIAVEGGNSVWLPYLEDRAPGATCSVREHEHMSAWGWAAHAQSGMVECFLLPT